jgi:hypothetical protein
MSTPTFLSALSLLMPVTGAAFSQPAPDQAAAPPGSNTNMGDGTGGGPSGSIGDPNGTGPGAASPSPPPNLVHTSAPPATLSKVDASTLNACLTMSHSEMTTTAKCNALMIRRPDLFNGETASAPAH